MPLRLALHGSQTLPHRFRVRVISAEYPLAVGERPLKHPDRLGAPPRGQVALREVVPRRNGVRVVGGRLSVKEREGRDSEQRTSNAASSEANPSATDKAPPSPRLQTHEI